jgi:GT2 family glycosyltransferase
VVIPTYGHRASLERVLQALARQTMPAHRYEIVVGIDGSIDGTEEMLASFKTPCPLIWRWQTNAGRAAACNLGVSIARGDLVVFLDDDLEPIPGFLEAHLEAHPPGTRRGIVGATPARLADRASVADETAGRFADDLDRPGAAASRFALRDFSGANFSISRSVLVAAHGFDVAFVAAGDQDLELCWRLLRAGVEIHFSAAAAAHRRRPGDFPALARDSAAKGRTAVLLAARHPSSPAALHGGWYTPGSIWRRLLVVCLLALTRIRPGTSAVVVRGVQALDRWRPPSLVHLRGAALDYFFELGAAAGRREIHEGRHADARR